MKKIYLVVLSLILSTVAMAESHMTTHEVRLAGLEPGEGRYILSAEYVNNKFRSGFYTCATSNDPVYLENYSFPKSQQPFHEDHLIKFSICQDETLANCQEFAVDKYRTFRNLEGYLQNDVSTSTIDVSPLKNMYPTCEPDVILDEVVKKSIHVSDRRFAHVG